VGEMTALQVIRASARDITKRVDDINQDKVTDEATYQLIVAVRDLAGLVTQLADAIEDEAMA
jgi:hypothetical protein